MVDAFRKIPELVTALNNEPEAIAGYYDLNPDRNSLANAIYTQAPGSILVAWTETLFAEEEVTCWAHMYEYYVRARRKGSPMEVITALVNGIPIPGDGQIWRYCPVMDGVLPTQVINISRIPDAEQIDLFVIRTETKETGDA